MKKSILYVLAAQMVLSPFAQAEIISETHLDHLELAGRTNENIPLKDDVRLLETHVATRVQELSVQDSAFTQIHEILKSESSDSEKDRKTDEIITGLTEKQLLDLRNDIKLDTRARNITLENIKDAASVADIKKMDRLVAGLVLTGTGIYVWSRIAKNSGLLAAAAITFFVAAVDETRKDRLEKQNLDIEEVRKQMRADIDKLRLMNEQVSAEIDARIIQEIIKKRELERQ